MASPSAEPREQIRKDPVNPAPDSVKPQPGPDAAEEAWRQVVLHSPLGMHFYELQDDDRLVFCGANPAADRLLRIDNAQFVGLTIEQAFPPLTATDVPSAYRRVAAQGEPWSTEQIEYSDGQILGAFAVHAFGIGGRRMVALFYDITERKRAEATLKDQTQQLDAFFNNALYLLSVADTDGRFLRVNSEWQSVLGYRAEDLEGRSFLELVHPADVEATLEAIQSLARQEPVLQFQNRYRHRDGTYRWLEWRSFPAGKIIYAAARDLTEERRSAATLRLNAERMEALLRLNQLVNASAREIEALALEEAVRLTRSEAGFLGFLDPSGSFLVVNVWSSRSFVAGASQPDSFRCPVTDEAGLGRSAMTGRASVTNSDAIDRGSYPDGHVTVFRRAIAPVVSGGIVVAVAGVENKAEEYDETDVRQLSLLMDAMWHLLDRKRTQERLLQAQKMESVGRLAGGVAHDFNNLLTVINGYSQLLLSGMSASDPVAPALQEISKAGERAAALVRQLLAFSRKQVLQTRDVDVNELMGGMRNLITRLVGEDVSVRVVLGKDLSVVRADPSQLEQVLMNLVVNARDAMPRGGKLTIETAEMELDEHYVGSHPDAHCGRHVLLAVGDTGQGLSEEARQHLFEPFFTTKEAGRGTGLGLAMVQGIVRQSGGHIEVYSERGEGTVFKVYLPAATHRSSDTVDSGVTTALAGVESILVVEDQREVREFAAAALRSYGYQVMQASSPTEALELVDVCGEINLVLTDVVMPYMNGRELAARLTSKRPQARVLFMSGYTDNVIVHHGILDDGTAFIQKPFTPEALAARVRKELDRGRPAAAGCDADDRS